MRVVDVEVVVVVLELVLVVVHFDWLHRNGSTTMSRPWLPAAVLPAASTSATSANGEQRSMRSPALPLSLAVVCTSVRSSDHCARRPFPPFFIRFTFATLL